MNKECIWETAKKLDTTEHLSLSCKVWASLVAQLVKNLPAMQETTYSAGDLGLTLGSGGSLEKEMATHSSILAWKTPWTEEPGRLQSMRWQRVRHDLPTTQQNCEGLSLLFSRARGTWFSHASILCVKSIYFCPLTLARYRWEEAACELRDLYNMWNLGVHV